MFIEIHCAMLQTKKKALAANAINMQWRKNSLVINVVQ